MGGERGRSREVRVFRCVGLRRGIRVGEGGFVWLFMKRVYNCGGERES